VRRAKIQAICSRRVGEIGSDAVKTGFPQKVGKSPEGAWNQAFYRHIMFHGKVVPWDHHTGLIKGSET
jgi:hypothetical protein